MTLDADAPVRTILALGQSELTRIFRTGSYYTKTEYPELAAENASVIVNVANWRSGGEGPVLRAVDDATIAAREVTPSMVALANLWHQARPGEHLLMVDGTVSGTSFWALTSDADTRRDWGDLEAVVSMSRELGHEIDDVVWSWYNSTAGGWKRFTESFAPGMFGQTASGETYDLGSGSFNHTLFDADVAFHEFGRGLFARDQTRLSVMSPGPSPDPGSPDKRNFTHTEAGAEIKGRTAQLDRPAIDAGAAFLDDPRLGPAKGANGPAPVVVKFGDYVGGARLPGGDTDIHPAFYTPYGNSLWAMHTGVAALIASGDAGEPRILGQRTSPDGLATEVVVSLPNGGTLSTLRQVTGHVSPDASLAPHQQADGTGFELRRAGQPDADRQPVWRPDADRADSHSARIEIADAGSGRGEARTATVKLHWSEPVASGGVLEYLRGGDFSGQLSERDYDREIWADFLVEHVPGWHDGSAFGYPGIPVRPQPSVAAMTLERDAGTVPGEAQGGGGGGTVAPPPPPPSGDDVLDPDLGAPAPPPPAPDAGTDARTRVDASGFTRGTAGDDAFFLGATRADVIGNGGSDLFVIEGLAGREHVVRDFGPDDAIDLSALFGGAGRGELVAVAQVGWNGRTHTRVSVDRDGDGAFAQAILLQDTPGLTLEGLIGEGRLRLAAPGAGAPTPPSDPPADPAPGQPDPEGPPSGPLTLTVWAGGETAAGLGPAFTVLADGAVIGAGQVAVATPSFEGRYEPFAFALPSAPSSVAIRYTNDRFISPGGPDQDRNLFIDRIEIGGARFEAELHGMVTLNSAGLAERYGLNGAREDVRANGTMLFESLDLSGARPAPPPAGSGPEPFEPDPRPEPGPVDEAGDEAPAIPRTRVDASGFTRGTAGDEAFHFGATRGDVLGGGGRDLFVIEALAGREHRVRDFGADDIVDLSPLLAGGAGLARVEAVGWSGQAHTRITVDRGAGFEQAILLANTEGLTLQAMIAEGSLIL